MCLKRLAQYKPLIGTLLYQVAETETEVSVEVLSANPELELPEILVGIEFVFLVELIRKATKESITPLSVTAKQLMKNPSYADSIGKPITVGNKNLLVLSKEDAPAPFISRNESMWEFFEPELKCRLSMTGTDDSCAARVRSALTERRRCLTVTSGYMSITTNTRPQYKGGDGMKLKDKKIEILAPHTVRDNEGFATTTLEPVDAPLWAYFRQLSGKEVFAAATTNYKEEVLFTINYRTDLTTACVVRYRGVLYDITRIDTFEGYKEDLTLYCSRRARQN